MRVKITLLVAMAFFVAVSSLYAEESVTWDQCVSEAVKAHPDLFSALAAKKAPLLKSKLLTTTEIVAAIDFFAADEARNITGQQLYFGGVR